MAKLFYLGPCVVTMFLIWCFLKQTTLFLNKSLKFPSVDAFRTVMRSYYNLEKYNAVKNKNIGHFLKAWNSYNRLAVKTCVLNVNERHHGYY